MPQPLVLVNAVGLTPRLVLVVGEPLDAPLDADGRRVATDLARGLDTLSA